MRMTSYDFKEIEKKWIDKYEGFDGYKGLDFETSKEKFYMLTEFPYPSGSGLHVGHAFSMTAADVYARFQRMLGKNVMFPMGWDAFGLPTENYAIRTGRNPKEITKEVTDNFKDQMKKLGFSFDWDREVDTTDPDYYRWTQWIFVKLFEKGLAEKQEMPINWCPKDKIGLANEEVIDGKCERCGAVTEKKNISQWVLKMPLYGDRLIEGLKNTEFENKIKAAQINWIGKKEGLVVDFKVENSENIIQCFTKFPETIFGVTWLVVSPEYSGLEKMIKPENKDIVMEYVELSKNKSEFDRTSGVSEKTGVFTGSYAENPVSKKLIPIWVGDYVLANFGTGAVMGVAPHDKRDFMFAKKYNLEMIQVEVPVDNPDYKINNFEEVIEDGLMINSGKFNGMKAREQAFEAMSEWMKESGWATKKVEYHLRDWIFSRQHYWGEPIPMIFCEKDGWVPVPEADLPVILPDVEKYQPTDTGESPLATIHEWVDTTCPKCRGKAKRETDTMPNWAGSDWYYIRYCDPKNSEVLADMPKMDYWLPVDVYFGGDEHTTLHLLYSRFIYQFLWDIGAVPKKYPEPYKKRLSHGVILGPDGNRMSKSRGNVIVPEEFVEKYGADSLRAYLMFMGPFDATMAWNERSLVGVRRFIEKVFRLVIENVGKHAATDLESLRLIHKLIKNSGDDMSQFKFNTVIAKLMETTNGLLRIEAEVCDEDLGNILKILAPFAPFVTEELWNHLGGEFSVHSQKFPVYDEKYLVNDIVTLSVQINGKMRGTVEVEPDTKEEAVVEKVKEVEKLEKYFLAGEIKNIIYIPRKTINFVIG